MKTVNVLLFEDFTTLDALGPAEVFSRLNKTYCASAPDRHCLRRRDCSTSNKIAWEWVTAQSEKVKWVRKARWVTDGKYYITAKKSGRFCSAPITKKLWSAVYFFLFLTGEFPMKAPVLNSGRHILIKK